MISNNYPPIDLFNCQPAIRRGLTHPVCLWQTPLCERGILLTNFSLNNIYTFHFAKIPLITKSLHMFIFFVLQSAIISVTISLRRLEMNILSGYLEKTKYLLFVFMIIAFWGCIGCNSSNEIEDIKEIVGSGDTQVDSEEDVNGGSDIADTSEDIPDTRLDGSDVSDVSDVCIPSCNGKQCGDDGCGGSCGVCGDNAVCNMGRCECKSGFANCNDKWDDRCEKAYEKGHIWSKRFGGAGEDGGQSISIDSSGNVFITGYFGSPEIDFGGGQLIYADSFDIFLAKFDNNGNHLWSKGFGGKLNDKGFSVSADRSGNVYITGKV